MVGEADGVALPARGHADAVPLRIRPGVRAAPQAPLRRRRRRRVPEPVEEALVGLAGEVGRLHGPELRVRLREVVREALAWWEDPARGEAPRLMWVHLFDAHTPYEPPADWKGDPYRGEIFEMDRALRPLLQSLPAPAVQLMVELEERAAKAEQIATLQAQLHKFAKKLREEEDQSQRVHQMPMW